ncbi:acyltransferase family protein [Roseateles sp. LKC17W]|uniref:Acyltransferase family protein n=1 Tax=Pelomonas margarita TaxID=3299031 RepID=A0ABW7FQ02_9BURK
MEYPNRNFVSLLFVGLPVWLSGAYLAEAIKGSVRFDVSKPLAVALWVAVLGGGGFAAVLKVAFGVSYAITLTIYAIFVVPWLWSMVFLDFKSQLLKLFGDASYSIYLLHQPLIPVVRREIERASVTLPLWAVDALTIVVVVAALLLFYYVVERPSHLLSRRLSAARNGARP